MKNASKSDEILSRIQVQVRVRNTPSWSPVKPKLIQRSSSASFSSISKDISCIQIPSTNTLQIVHPEGKKPAKEFTFDALYSPVDSQEDIYKSGAQSLIDKCLEGYNGCIFVYGQTASGKTHTMQGSQSHQERGLIQRSVEHIVNHINSMAGKPKKSPTGQRITTEFSVKASYLEIYQENLKDLLCNNDAQAELRIRMDPDSLTGRELHVQGITERSVVELNDYMKILEIGSKNRTVAETNMNEVSSRSHAVLTLTIEQIQYCEQTQTVGNRKRSKIHFIDLAGTIRI
jgi:hypothetical protein